MDYKIIAIDGPAGAGKSTIARKLADCIGYTYIDSGAMYRALTLKVLRENIPLKELDCIINMAVKTDIDFRENSIYLDGKAADAEIREENVNRNVSYIAAIPEVRKLMVELQRKISRNKNVVMDGRDVGTVIFPSANIKFYITASVEERAERRYNELKQKGYDAEIQDIKSQIEKRDHIDSTRSESPLMVASDAIIIETTGKKVEEVLDEVISKI
ncbi:MAG: cytidylate kinase [Clostridia bacterium BRH_c25]|nr:MAG: cytidylate kinase [Clostridia bacterium BRH_c25]